MLRFGFHVIGRHCQARGMTSVPLVAQSHSLHLFTFTFHPPQIHLPGLLQVNQSEWVMFQEPGSTWATSLVTVRNDLLLDGAHENQGASGIYRSLTGWGPCYLCGTTV